MAKAKTLDDLFLDELRDAYDAEKQLTKALPKMAKAASSDELRTAIESHLEETRGHYERLERVFEMLDEKPKGKHCAGIAGIIEEASEALDSIDDDAVLDAAIIAGGQRAEHYEMAAYGTLIAWAGVLGHNEAVEILEQTLNEEKAADRKLSQLAEGGINEEASGGSSSDEDEDDEEEMSAKPQRQDKGAARR
jgi:ferritin-like metal-binding protein YciE